MITSRNVKELTAFVVFLGVTHYAYYKIQNNPNLVHPNQRAELFYVRWLKEAFPALKKYGIQEVPKPEH
uniref:Uncharacterized protein n=1 Tax=Panagrolaimus sp. JU765 TaxID=591449 RepID=A0AC34RB26_9BILA